RAASNRNVRGRVVDHRSPSCETKLLPSAGSSSPGTLRTELHMPASRLLALATLGFVLFAASGGLRAQPQPADAVVVLKGHTETVEAVAVSPDGKFIATACFDKTIRLFDAATGKEIRSYGGAQGHTNQVLCVAFSAKGDQIASGGADNKLL